MLIIIHRETFPYKMILKFARTCKIKNNEGIGEDINGPYMYLGIIIIGPQREKHCLRGLASNKGADKPAHLRSLISAFVIRLLESTITRLAKSEISIF